MSPQIRPGSHRGRAIIHREALAHNLRRAKQLAQGSKVFAVVKGDAYGHGIENVVYGLDLTDGLNLADGFAVLDLDEVGIIRRRLPNTPVLMLEGAFSKQDLASFDLNRVWHVVHCTEQVEWLAGYSPSIGWKELPEYFAVIPISYPPQRVFIKVNTGMNRFGFRPNKVRGVWERLSSLPHVDVAGFMTHFSDSDGSRGIDHQLQVFNDATRGLPGERTLSNSAAILRHARVSDVHANWVRAGLMLYGSSPDYPEHDAGHWDLQPAMSLRASIIAVQDLEPGDTVGYGSTFTASMPMRIGIVSCGFADGYPRGCPNGTPMLVDGVRAGSVGRGSMDTLVVDLTDLPAAGRGSEVTLWGRSSRGTVLPLEEVAGAAGLFADLTCGITRRVARVLEF